jgi:hypothetical protein
MGGPYSGHGEKRNAYRILVGMAEGKGPLGRPRHRWEDIKVDLRKMEFEVVEWIHMAQDKDQLWALENTVMNLRVP